VGAIVIIHSLVSGAPINSASAPEKAIMRPDNASPMVIKTINDVSNILFASLILPDAMLLETIIDMATGKPAVEITYKKA
jgi:hypothetical protein